MRSVENPGSRRSRCGSAVLLAWIPGILAVLPGARTSDPGEEAAWQRARSNARLAADCARFCRGLLRSWSTRGEATTGLLPERPDNPVWTPENSAADLLPWLVLSAEWVGTDQDRQRLRRLLATEIALTTRMSSMPDAVELVGLEFYYDPPHSTRLVVGAVEYAKDGLLPLLEALGPSPWSDRLLSISRDLAELEGPRTPFGHVPSSDAEINGHVLQTLARVYHFTGDRRYAGMVGRIVRAYLELVAPVTGGLPCHRFDFEQREVEDARLCLHDHGCEILAGLVEALPVLDVEDPELARRARAWLRDVLAELAAVALTPGGLPVSEIDARTKAVLDPRTPDTWAYPLYAFFAFGELDEEASYAPLVTRALDALGKGACSSWTDADSWADSIEGALVLVNRVPSSAAEEYVLRCTPALLAFQGADGHVTGTYGDGNAARTARLVARWLRAGTELAPERDDVLLGAVAGAAEARFVLAAERDYVGVWRFDEPRHRRILRYPANLPRINEDPEWFTVEGDEWYAITVDGGVPRLVLGAELRDGVPVSVEAGQERHVHVRALGPASDGKLRIRVRGPRVVPRAATEVELAVAHELPFEVHLHTTSDAAEARLVVVPPGEERVAAFSLPPPEPAVGGLQQRRITLVDASGVLVGRWIGYALPGVLATDVRLLRGDGEGGNLSWRVAGAQPVLLELDAGADASALELRLFADGATTLTLGGKETQAVPADPDAGGAEFRWWTAAVPVGAVQAQRLTLAIAPRDGASSVRVALVVLGREAPAGS